LDVGARNRAARDYRDGLLIAFLAYRPLRVANLLQMNIGTHLKLSGDRATVDFGKLETKTERALNFTWPQTLKPALDRYVDEIRPILISANIPYRSAPAARPAICSLWLGQGGTALSAAGLYKAILRHTRPRFGKHLVAQRFRDCVASTIANENPDQVRYAAHLLGHTGPRTTERNYIARDSRLALNRHHDMIKSMRGPK
jgi:integrase